MIDFTHGVHHLQGYDIDETRAFELLGKPREAVYFYKWAVSLDSSKFDIKNLVTENLFKIFPSWHRVLDFVDDIVTYIVDWKLRKTIISSYRQHLKETKPSIIIAHSLGSVKAWDALSKPIDGYVPKCLILIGSPLWILPLRLLTWGKPIAYNIKILAGSCDPVTNFGQKWTKEFEFYTIDGIDHRVESYLPYVRTLIGKYLQPSKV